MRRLMWRLGRKIYLNARGDIANDIDSNGESNLQRRILENAQKNGGHCVVLDIGANLGLWTQAFTSHAQGLNLTRTDFTIYSFEPVPTAREKLIENLQTDIATFDVRILPVAMSDETSSQMMTINGETSGSNSLEADDSVRDVSGLSKIEVQTSTLEDFAKQEGIETFNLIKCDTEGHDAFVIDGAKGLLGEGRIEVFQFEYNHRWVYGRRYLKDVFDLIEELAVPYKLARLSPKALEVYDVWHPEMERFFESNYALIRADILPSLDVHLGVYDATNTYA